MQKDLDSSCLGSIFRGHIRQAQVNCRFSVQPRKEAVVETSQGTFRIFPQTQEAEGEMTCLKKKRLMKFHAGSEISIQPGCSLDLENHVISIDEAEQVEIDHHISTWHWDAAAMFPDHPIEVVNLALEKLQNLGLHNVDATDIIHQIRTLPTNPEIVSHFETFSKFSWIISIIVLFFFLLLGFYFYRRFRSHCSNFRRSSRRPSYNSIIRYSTRNNQQLRHIQQRVAQAENIEELANIEINLSPSELAQARGEISEPSQSAKTLNEKDSNLYMNLPSAARNNLYE